MTDTTHHGDDQNDRDREHIDGVDDVDRVTPHTGRADDAGEATDAGTAADANATDVFDAPAADRPGVDGVDADGSVGGAPSASSSSHDGRGDDHETAQYTVPYPVSSHDVGPDAQTTEYPRADDSGQAQSGSQAAHDEAAGQYGQDAGRYGQASGSQGERQYGEGQYGQPQGQYGQGHGQYGQGQYGQYGQPQAQYGQGHDQYGQGHDQYGQGQYGQPQAQYGQPQAQYGQGHDQYGQGQYGQHAGGAYYGQAAAPASSQAPGSAQAPASSQAPTSAFGDVDGAARRNGTYFADGSGFGGDAAASGTTKTRNGRKALVLPLLGMLVVGAVIGGIAGGGWVAATNGNGSSTSSTPVGSTGGGNLTVNDYNSATVVTAVAAKATPSVVTINVSAGSEAGTGSGVVLNKDGYIVTNTHVVTLDGDSSKGTIQVTTSDGKIYKGTLVGTDPTVDLAVIKIDDANLTPMAFADSSKLNVGDTAVAIGAPLGLSNTVTDGIVSTLNRSIQVASSAPSDSSSGDSNDGGGNNGQGPYDFWGNGDNGSSATAAPISLPVIQTDAAINPGNSGGALLDSKGRLIGINVAIASAGQSSSSSDAQSGSIGVGFAIPSNLAKRVAGEIIENGKATHGLLGATVGDATADTKASHVGAVIKSVTSGGAAANAGLREGDVVTALGGASVADGTDLTAQVRYNAGGAKTTITYERNGQSSTADVTLGTYTG